MAGQVQPQQPQPLSPATAPLSTNAFYAACPLLNDAPKSIRLLDLPPLTQPEIASGSVPRLAGRLRTVNLDDSPSFTVLSYVWGQKSTPSHTITISCHASPEGNINSDGQQTTTVLEITANCHAALQQIRRRFGAVTIWVDAICINQDDEAEKTVQIPLMRDIYTWATTTYIFLGEGTTSSGAAMDYLNWCSPVMARLPVEWLAAMGAERQEQELSRFKAEVARDTARRSNLVFRPGRSGRASPQDIGNLLSRPWVFRAWTFQELILSANPVVLCGDRVLTWSSLTSSLTYACNSNSQHYTPERRLIRWRTRSLISDTNDEHNAALNRWWALLEIWKRFPRETSWNGRQMRFQPPPGWKQRREAEERANGFEEASLEAVLTSDRLSFMYAVNECGILDASTNLFRIRRWALTALSTIVWFFLWGYILFLAITGLSVNFSTWGNSTTALRGVRPDINYDSLQKFLWFVVAWTFAFVVGASSWSLLYVWCLSRFVATGISQEKYLGDPSYPRLREVLGGIHDALRHRACQLPHDRSFALDGVLATICPASHDSAGPDYREPWGLTYMRLLERLIRWQPVTISMIVDAGVSEAPSGAPSWVPSWGCSPSRWLSFRYGVEPPAPSMAHRHLADAPRTSIPVDRGLIPMPRVDGRKLKLKAQTCGDVRLRVAFEEFQPLSSTAATQQQHNGAGRAGPGTRDTPGEGSGVVNGQIEQHEEEDQAIVQERKVQRLLDFIREFATRGHCWVQRQSPEGPRYPQCAAYLVIRGLTTPYVETFKEERSYKKMIWGSSYERELADLPMWQAPYDFSDEKVDFVTFARVYELVAARAGNPPSVSVNESASGASLARATRSLAVGTDGNQAWIRLGVYNSKGKSSQGLGTNNPGPSAAAAAQDDYASCREAIPGSIELLAKIVDQIVAEKRCLFMLSTGRIGSGPLGLEEGDEVFSLQGVPTPMVLREVKTPEPGGKGKEAQVARTLEEEKELLFTNIGAALVHARMHGEDDGPHLEDVTII